jgi:hypothetical protein
MPLRFASLRHRAATRFGEYCPGPKTDAELAENVEIALGAFFTGDEETLMDRIVTSTRSRDEALRLSLVLTGRLVSAVSVLAAETGDDGFACWARLVAMLYDDTGEPIDFNDPV